MGISQSSRRLSDSHNGHQSESGSRGGNACILTFPSLTAGPDDDDPVFAAAASTLAENPAREDMQTFVFSATLSKDLQHNLKRRKVYNGKKPHKKATALGGSRHQSFLYDAE